MSASTRVQVLADKAEELSLLAEFLKNPDLITDLQDEIKKLNSLTADEEEKLVQARAELKGYAEKTAALKSERDQLDTDKENHESAARLREERLDLYAAGLAAEATKQIDTAAALDAKDKGLSEERKRLDIQAATDKKNFSEIIDGLAKREDKLAADEARNSIDRAGIESDKKKLAEKLRLLQAE